MTWKLIPVSDEEAFASIKAGIEALPPGMKMFLNSGECASGLHHFDSCGPQGLRAPLFAH